MSAALAERRAGVPARSHLDWLVDHWLGPWNGFMALYVGLPVLAPILVAAGASALATHIYWFYSFTCHQMAD